MNYTAVPVSRKRQVGTIRTGGGEATMSNFLLEMNPAAGCEVWSASRLESTALVDSISSKCGQRTFSEIHTWVNLKCTLSQHTMQTKLLLTGEPDLEKGRTVEREEKGGQPVRETEDVSAHNLSFWYTHWLMYITAITETIHFYHLQNSFNISKS